MTRKILLRCLPLRPGSPGGPGIVDLPGNPLGPGPPGMPSKPLNPGDPWSPEDKAYIKYLP